MNLDSKSKIIKDYAKYIEYTNLKSPNSKQIKKIVQIANERNYLGVCLQPGDLGIAVKYKRPKLKLITVAGFPPIHSFNLFSDNRNKRLHFVLGFYRKKDIEEINTIIDNGIADELDLVFPMYWYVRGKFTRIYKFFSGIKKRYRKPVKVIVELGTILNREVVLYEVIDLLKQSGVDYLKTNTGLIKQSFKNLYTSIFHAKLLMRDMNIQIPIKASGGIRTEEEVQKLIQIGVHRIGTSSIPKVTQKEEVKKND